MYNRSLFYPLIFMVNTKPLLFLYLKEDFYLFLYSPAPHFVAAFSLGNHRLIKLKSAKPVLSHNSPKIF